MAWKLKINGIPFVGIEESDLSGGDLRCPLKLTFIEGSPTALKLGATEVSCVLEYGHEGDHQLDAPNSEQTWTLGIAFPE